MRAQAQSEQAQGRRPMANARRLSRLCAPRPGMRILAATGMRRTRARIASAAFAGAPLANGREAAPPVPPATRVGPLRRLRTLLGEPGAGDLRAAWVSAIVMIPQAVAFAVISGLPPEAGLCASVWPVIVASLLGASPLVLSGPNTAVSLMLATALLPLASASSSQYLALTALLTLMVGLVQLAASACGVGRWLARLPALVSTGLSAGIGIVMISSQLAPAFGLLSASDMPPWTAAQYAMLLADRANPYAIAVALAALGAGALSSRLRIASLPPLVCAMVGGSLVAVLLDLALGTELTRIERIGYLDIDFAATPLPHVDWGDLYVLKRLAASAVAIAAVGGLQTILISRSLEHGRADGASARDLMAQGAANLVAAISGGFAGSGSFNRTAAHVKAGATTRFAAVLSSLLLLALACLGGRLFAIVAAPAVAATIMLIGWGMLRSALPAILRTSGFERACALAIVVAVAALGIEGALLVAVVLGYASLARRASADGEGPAPAPPATPRVLPFALRCASALAARARGFAPTSTTPRT